MNDSYQVKLDAFEGPLDLLLHLINQFEIDIYDIPVAEITDQYLHYIHTMQQIELNVASEYLVMASTLLEMKSAMLLPKKEIVEIDEYEEDPREQLMLRLIEYRKFKEAATQLQEKELEENQLFTRNAVSFPELNTEKEKDHGDLSLYDLIDALEAMFQRKRWTLPIETTVNRVEISLEQRVKEIFSMLQSERTELAFHQLFPYPEKKHVVTTFLAILQLLKNNEIFCKQKAQFETIYVSLKEA